MMFLAALLFACGIEAQTVTVQAESTTVSSGAINIQNTGDVGGGQKLYVLTAGQTFDYSVNITTAGFYKIAVRLCNEQQAVGNSTVHFEFPTGTNVSGPLSLLNNTQWTTVTSTKTFALTAGTQKIRLVADTLASGKPTSNPTVVQVNWFSLTFTAAPDTLPPTVTITSPVPGTYSTATMVVIHATDNVGVAQVTANIDNQDLGAPSVSAGLYTFATDVTRLSLGPHTLNAKASDAAGNIGTTSLAFSSAATISTTAVTVPLVIVTSSLPAATVGLPYTAQLTASGGTPPYSWSATGMPAGMTISTTGLISWTPSAAVDVSLSISVSDASGKTARKVFGKSAIRKAKP